MDFSQRQLNKPGPGAFDTRPAAVKKWLEELPLGHVGEAARRLYAVLREVNELDIDVHHRFEFLEQVTTPLDTVIRALKQHYVGAAFPLDEKSIKVAQLTTELMAAMVNGYQLVMMQSDKVHWLRQRRWEKIWATALHRMFHYFSGILCNYRLLNLANPPGIWLKLHRAYRLLEENGMLDTGVSLVGQGAGTTTLGHEYKRLLLMSVLATNRLRPAQLEEMQRCLDKWSPLLVFRQPPGEFDCQDHYCIDLDRDLPPVPLWRLQRAGQVNLASVRRLEVDKLVNTLESALQTGGEAAALVEVPQLGRVQRTTLTVALESWRQPPERQQTRQVAAGRKHVVFGLGQVHCLLQAVSGGGAVPGAAVPAAAEPAGLQDWQVAQVDKSRPRQKSWGFMGDRDTNVDVWDMVYTQQQTVAKSWTEVQVSRSYRMVEAEQTDQSSGGIGLYFPGGQLDKVKDGDLLAYNNSDQVSDWSVGMVRWMRMKSGSKMEMGVKQLLERVVPATLRVQQGKQLSDPIECLLGHEHEQLRIILPHLASLAHKPLVLISGGKEASIRLQEALEVAPHFSLYHFHEVAPSTGQKSPVSPEGPGGDEFDKYKSLWDLL